jgi:NDP-sugar pyrophosphorylase family protein/aminoglycoside/choline kinase family phosphotransferase
LKTIRAFILAAGYGERLRPMTDHIPKPLLPIVGRPIIEIVIERLAMLPVGSLGINIHHKPEMLMQWTYASQFADKIELFHEKVILGTGGALKNASEFLGSSAFIVHNADILSDISLEMLVEEHFLSGNIVTLAVHDHEKFNNLWTDIAGNLRNVGNAGIAQSGLCKVAFTGIAVYSPEFLDFLPEGNSSVVDAWLKALASGRKIGTVDFSGCSWTDIGTPAYYANAVFDALRKTGETIYVHASADCGKAEIGGHAAIEQGCVIGAGAYLKNCVVLPGARIANGSSIEDALVGPDYVIRLEKEKGATPPGCSLDMAARFFRRPLIDLGATLVGTGGSDRKYYRLSDQEKSAVLMVCSPDDPDYDRHIAYTLFFRRHSLPVPEMFEADEVSKQALFEDLGDLSLYAWLQCRRESQMIEGMYRRVLDILIDLHTEVSGNIAECPLLDSRVFDYEHLRWETSYFMERFVSGHAGMKIKDGRGLKEEFQVLAETVDSFPKTVVHRDFQSQNLMVTKGGILRLIDYQGARIGPPAYDLASVLWDPYHRIEEDMQERLVCHYIEKMRAVAFNDFDKDEFRYALLLCRLQRHMQALGAYGFLANIKGKKNFIKHIPQALRYLAEETALAAEDFPVLYELVSELNARYAEENRP